MDTDNLSDKERKLIELIGSSPLRPVPDDLVERVMSRVTARKKVPRRSFWASLQSLLKSLQPRPVHAFTMVALALISFYAGKNWQTNVSPLQEFSTAESLYGQESLDDPAIAYAVGRTLLQSEGQESKALAYLQRASMLDPDNPEFAYWEGVGYWVNGDSNDERRSYERGLLTDPESIPLLLNLGHSYLSEKNYHEALGAYRKVLRHDPEEQSAIYNSGLIYRKLGMVPEELKAWRYYLRGNRLGSKAIRAVRRLNSYGDFSFRIYSIGYRDVIVNHQALIDISMSHPGKLEELEDIAAIIKHNPTMMLEVVAFVENDLEAARNMAVAVKKRLVDTGGMEMSDQVRLSWFNDPEIVRVGDEIEPLRLNESVFLFARPQKEYKREDSV